MTHVFISLAASTAAAAALAASSVTDLKDRCIPNELVVMVAVSGVALGLIARPGQVWISLLIAVAVVFALGVLAHYRVVGNGDAKLVAAATLLVPPDRVGTLLLAIALAGGALSCIYFAARLALRRMPAPAHGSSATANGLGTPALRNHALRQFLHHERARIIGGRSMPYAMAIFGGVALCVATEEFRCFYATC